MAETVSEGQDNVIYLRDRHGNVVGIVENGVLVLQSRHDRKVLTPFPLSMILEWMRATAPEVK